jgi:hypothetical protein
MRDWSAMMRWRFSSSVEGLGSVEEQALSNSAEAMAVMRSRVACIRMFIPLHSWNFSVQRRYCG